jgi:hypothetical protein
MAKATNMSSKSTTRLVREGEFVAEVAVTLVETGGGWTPYLSLEDAYKLDDVREALRTGDIKRAARLSNRVYRLTPFEA